ncbi:MAG: peptidoglycan DD-metalloendopeptidase family protein [Desulfomonilia bacterium]|jgi:septal ring factor EnvC (AmiA/AmiB activator)
MPRFAAPVLAVLAVLAAAAAWAADDASREIEALREKARQVEGTRISEEKKLKNIDLKIQQIQGRIAEVKESVASRRAQIALLDKELASCEADFAAAEKNMHGQWVEVYKGASLDLINAYHGNERYAGYVRAILEDRSRRVEEYRKLKQERAATREKTRRLAELLEKDLAELSRALDDLAAQRARKAQLVSSLQGQSRQYQDRIQDLLERLREEARKAPEPESGFAGSKGRLPWPVEGKVVRKFGRYVAHGVPQRSQGIDIECPEGSPVRSVYPGTVVYVDWMGGYGNTVILDHGQGYYSVYAHLREALRSVGDKVGSRETIGRVGQSGDALKPTLHFEIRSGGKAQDPHAWLLRK